jgi:hypothetical protein
MFCNVVFQRKNQLKNKEDGPMQPFFKIAMVTAAGILFWACDAPAQVGGGAMGGGGMAGSVGGFAGGGLTGGTMGGGMANGNLMGGNLSSGQGMGFGGAGMAGANLAGIPQMGRGAGMAGGGQAMLQGMPGATMGAMAGSMSRTNANSMAFSQGSNLGLFRGAAGGGGMFSGQSGRNASLGASGNLLYGAQGNNRLNGVFGPASGGFSSWGGGNMGFGMQRSMGAGYGMVTPSYTGSPMFGGTARQQMYSNNYGGGGGF